MLTLVDLLCASSVQHEFAMHLVSVPVLQYCCKPDFSSPMLTFVDLLCASSVQHEFTMRLVSMPVLQYCCNS